MWIANYLVSSLLIVDLALLPVRMRVALTPASATGPALVRFGFVVDAAMCDLETVMLSAEAIVTLGCRVSAEGALSTEAKHRVERAVSAYEARIAPWIVVSGGRRWGGPTEAEALRDALVERGVPESAVLLECRSMSTVENAFFTVDLLRRRGARVAPQVRIATSASHMPRALRSFRRAGANAAACAPLPGESTPALRTRVREVLSWQLDRGLWWLSGPEELAS